MLAVAPELGASGDSVPQSPSLPAATLSAREESAAEVLARFGGRRDAAAQHLGISRTTWWRRLRAS